MKKAAKTDIVSSNKDGLETCINTAVAACSSTYPMLLSLPRLLSLLGQWWPDSTNTIQEYLHKFRFQINTRFDFLV